MPAQLSPTVSVSAQISPADCADLAAQGFAFIVNNRPDDEERGQPGNEAIAAAAKAAGMGYAFIPVDQSGFAPEQVHAMADAMARSAGPVFAFCRSGTRSCHLWALAEASMGAKPVALIEAAEAAGYDIAMLAGTLRRISEGAASR